jgi:hypothetical protein
LIHPLTSCVKSYILGFGNFKNCRLENFCLILKEPWLCPGLDLFQEFNSEEFKIIAFIPELFSGSLLLLKSRLCSEFCNMKTNEFMIIDLVS